jgi:hypothetical protein
MPAFPIDPTVPTLTTPCTLAALQYWLEHVVAPLNSGAEEATATVTTTSSTINVS